MRFFVKGFLDLNNENYSISYLGVVFLSHSTSILKTRLRAHRKMSKIKLRVLVLVSLNNNHKEIQNFR